MWIQDVRYFVVSFSFEVLVRIQFQACQRHTAIRGIYYFYVCLWMPSSQAVGLDRTVDLPVPDIKLFTS